MPTYNDKKLTKFKGKNGGKNQSKVDGFYRNSDGFEFFIKKPTDIKELFTELFAGLLIQEFKQRGLIPKHYHPSLICADIIQFEDGSYGLIQPKVSFTELYKLIGTGYRNGSDRDPLTEMFFGPSYYQLITQETHYLGLSIALMFSLLLGDYSVHSGNVVCLNIDSSKGRKITQFARIDWGAAFRHFAHKNNNENILNPLEYQGWFNPKGYTKGYFLNYKKIRGLFPAIADKAKNLIEQLNDLLLIDIVSSVLKKIPADLIDDKTKKDLGQYLGMDSFYEIGLGHETAHQPFITDFVEILNKRLKKISELQDLPSVNKNLNLYQSMILEDTTIVADLDTSVTFSFPEQMRIWLSALSSSDEKNHFNFNAIELPKLANQFNNFIEVLLHQAEELTHCDDNLRERNISQTCAQHPKSIMLRHLFSLKADASPRFPTYKKKKPQNTKQANDSYWEMIETVLTTSFNVIVTIKVLQNTQNSTDLETPPTEAIDFLLDALTEYLVSFQINYQCLTNYLEKPTVSSLIGSTHREKSSSSTSMENKGSLLFLQTNFMTDVIIKLQEKAKADNILWNAVKGAKKEQLSPRLADDLLALKEFHDRKIALNINNQFGEDYNRAIDEFYKNALSTRLSGATLSKQAETLLLYAYQKFQHRHYKSRILADALMIIGILFGIGLVIGLSRKAMKKPFFFSSAPTNRQQEFSNNWLVNREKLLTNYDNDGHLIDVPKANF